MKKVWIPLILLTMIFSGCGPTDQPAASLQEESPSALAEDPEAVSQDQAGSDSGETSPTATAEVIHQVYPASFVITPLQRIFDCTTGQRAAAAGPLTLSSSCDQWEINYFERPVSQEIGDYLPQLDITQAEFGQDESWYYARLFLFSDGYQTVMPDGIYAIELDLNLDARGDVLVLAFSPALNPAGEWSVNGVQVWLDLNDDVGGLEAMQADPGHEGDGYEKLVFDSGLGEDPDLAWVKLSLEEPGLIEFAFKKTLLGGVESFEWWMWAMKEDLGAGRFDPVDFFLADSVFYLDNTCGWIYGASLRDLPNLCSSIKDPKAPTKQQGVCQPPPGTCNQPCEIWFVETCQCICFN